MGSSEKHRDRGGAEAAEEAQGAAGATPAGGRPREHRRHRRRGEERRGKRSRSRGARSGGGGSGGSRRGGPEEPGRGGHERGAVENERRSKRERREDRKENAATPKTSESSLSVEEINKLRTKLGLKPLEQLPLCKKKSGTKDDPVAADVVNPLILRQCEEIREKLRVAEEKRLLNQKLGKVKTLWGDDPWLDDAAAWIERSRKLQREKELADKRAKLLEEMEQEFGVGTLVEEEFLRRKMERCSARDLQGLYVEHDPGALRQWETLVLMLKDKGVLEEAEDVLVNVTLQSQAQAEQRCPQPRHSLYDDATNPQKAHELLPKYTDPPSLPSFRMGTVETTVWEGGDNGAPPGPAPQSLELPLPRLAAEYLTREEMERFRPHRRWVKRLQRKEKEQPLCADDLVPMAPRDTSGDFGRGRRLHQVLELLRAPGGVVGGPDPRLGGSIVFSATSEFCRTLGEIPTYGMAGNRGDTEDITALERSARPSSPLGAPDSDGKENMGWSSVNLAEERQLQDLSAASMTILDEEPIVNRGLAAVLMLCQNKGLLETMVQKVPRVKAPNKSLPSAVYCIEDKMAMEDKLGRPEFRGFAQEFRDKDGYRPDVKIEYVDETGRKLSAKEAFRQLSHRFHGKGSGKRKTERRMKKLDEEALLKHMSSSDTPLGTVTLLQEKQRAQKTPFIVLSGGGKSMNVNTITK